MKKSEYAETTLAFVSKGKQYYYLNINPVDMGDGNYICIRSKALDHKPTEQDKSQLYNDYLQICQKVACARVSEYALTSQVRSFFVGEYEMKLIDSYDRNSIRTSALDKQSVGRSTYNLTLVDLAGQTYNFSLTPTKVVDIISKLEIYASDCHDVAENHKQSIRNLSDINLVEQYDCTTNYPDKVRIEIE